MFEGYMVALEMIFIPLATLNAAYRNQPSHWFLMMVGKLVRLARSCRWLMPKYYPMIYRTKIWNLKEQRN